VDACDWAATAEPHWTVALPWILASAAADGSIDHAVADARVTSLAGTYDAVSGAFALVVLLQGAPYVEVDLAGTVDPAAMSGTYTRTLVDETGAATTAAVTDTWSACDLARVGPVAVPFADPVDDAAIGVEVDDAGVATMRASTWEGGICDAAENGLSAARVMEPDGTLAESGSVEVFINSFTHGDVAWTLAGGDDLAVTATVDLDFEICMSSHVYGSGEALLSGFAGADGASSWGGDAEWDVTVVDEQAEYRGTLDESGEDGPSGGTASWTLDDTRGEYSADTGIPYCSDTCTSAWSTDPSARSDTCDAGGCGAVYDTIWFLDAPLDPWW
jgi:hypothetical protein